MAQNDKQQLLLKDLSGRLSYGVILKTPHGDGYLNEVSLCIFGHKLGVNIKATERTCFKLEECKPYLRSMSNMTIDEIKHYHDLCIWSEANYREFDELGDEIKYYEYYDTWESIDYLNSIHVDYRGLIPMGLAIAVTKENNPYKN